MTVQRIYKFVVVLILISANIKTNAQNRPLSVVPSPVVFTKTSSIEPVLKTNDATAQNATWIAPRLLSTPVTGNITADYYTKHFGFFCKKELQFEKATAIPLKFRLGSLDYVNKLEGK